MVTCTSPSIVFFAMAGDCQLPKLFQLCCNTALESIYLLEQIPFCLPKSVVEFLLILACEKRKALAVQKLVELWPYPELTLNHVESKFWRTAKANTAECLAPREYFGIFCWNVLTGDLVSAIALGLFNHVMYRRHVLQANGWRPPHTVDLAGVCIKDGMLHRVV